MKRLPLAITLLNVLVGIISLYLIFIGRVGVIPIIILAAATRKPGSDAF